LGPLGNNSFKTGFTILAILKLLVLKQNSISKFERVHLTIPSMQNVPGVEPQGDRLQGDAGGIQDKPGGKKKAAVDFLDMVTFLFITSNQPIKCTCQPLKEVLQPVASH
jgi:hypothetical protein